MTLASALARADALGAEGKYFEAHEELEAAWMKAAGPEKTLLQGLIQLAAGLHRLRLDPKKPEGAFYLLDKGLEKLAASRALLEPASLDALAAAMAAVRAGGRAPATLRFGLRPTL